MSEKIDYKKEYKDIYMPKTKPMLIDIPEMTYIMIQGKGNPNEEEGEYKQAIALLYALSYTIKMSKMGKVALKGYFDYVVPPLEGLWWSQDGVNFDYKKKDRFEWYAMIRQPEFVTPEVFEWACEEVKLKKNLDPSIATLTSFKEGLCVQVMHKGSYDNEAESIAKLEEYMIEENLENDIGTQLEDGMTRYHHEIYLGDPRKVAPENLKTVLRIPVREK